MPDLDQSLAADADLCRAADGDASSLDAALDQALRTLRYRRIRTAAFSAAAIAAVGVGTLWAAHPISERHKQQPTRFAAYDRVLGTVPGDTGSVYVVGPKDEHTATCTVVADSNVRILTAPDPSATDGTRVIGVAITSRADGADHDPANLSFEYPVGTSMPPGPYYYFTCPTP